MISAYCGPSLCCLFRLNDCDERRTLIRIKIKPMVRIVHITGCIDAMNTILSYITFGLGTKCIYSCHIIHMFGIMMDQIRMNSVISHTIHRLRPSPPEADTAIRHFTDLIMFHIDIADLSRSDGKASPIFIANFSKIAIIDLLMCTYFPTVGRIIR